MSRTEQRAHIDQVIQVAASESGDADHVADPFQRSWIRCAKEYGMDPACPRAAHIVDQTLLRERQDAMGEFMRIARAGMEQLYKRVSGLGNVLLLTDATGITVDYIGDDCRERELRRAGLYLGADWSEQRAGTCGVGTCAVEQVPLTCHRNDHFDVSHVGLTCTAAPLFSPKGDLMGVLDVSALASPESRDSQQLTFHLTVMYAQLMEASCFLRHFQRHWILRLGAAWSLVEVSGEMLIAFDRDGMIVGANSAARRTLMAPGTNDFSGKALTEIFDIEMDELWRFARQGSASETSTLKSRDGGQMHYATVIAPRVQIDIGRSLGDTEKKTSSVECAALDRLTDNDRQMTRLIDQCKRLVNKKVNILLHGETGTGKEVMARALHVSSMRRHKPFIAVNCAAIPESLIESELFGYTGGSFTGGRAKGKAGLIEQSDGGTLFLDEIGDMPLQLQTRLLRVLSEGEVMPIGATRAIPIDLTVVSASHRDLRRLIAEGVFREDLYYRLAGASLSIPSLCERTDKEYLIRCVLEEEGSRLSLVPTLSPDALETLTRFYWPGNVRQLRNVLRFALAISDDGYIDTCHLPEELNIGTGYRAKPQPLPLGMALQDLSTAKTQSEWNCEHLQEALRRHQWNITAVSEELNISRSTVYRQMKRYRIKQPDLVF
jgi:transcriptional regulator of acetoin/glycerol metabolism